MTDPRSFPRLWREAVDRWPDRVAIELPASRREITYAELFHDAMGMAAKLALEGVSTGHLVGLRLTDRRSFCTGLLGAWLADAVPVPLSVTAPDSYVRTLEQRAGVAVTLSGSVDGTVRATQATEAARAATVAPDLAYVMHTSGSTGLPKPVAVSHQALASYREAFVAATALRGEDRFLQLAPATFDVVLEELIPIWSVGGTSVLAPETPDDPGRLLADVERRGVTVAEVTTVYWRLLVRHMRTSGARIPGCLRLLLAGGESASPALIRESLDMGVPLAHVYGVTEAAITSTIAFFDGREPVTAAWVGLPLSNTVIAIVGGDGTALPDGDIGEVWIGGAGLADSYLHDLDGGRERFVSAPIGPPSNDRWYRTGDAGRVIDGSLEVFGRLDHQVKVNGMRVDLTEIELALVALPTVVEAAVIAVGGGERPTRLVGFITPADQDVVDPGPRAHDALRESLPPHLVPARIIVLDSLPVTAHGKVDRRGLAGLRHDITVPDIPGATPSERVVADAWATAVGRPPADLDQGFFDVGGDSLDLLSLVVILEERGIMVTPTDCLVYPTVRAMGALIDGVERPRDEEDAAQRAARRSAYLARRRRDHRGAG